MITSAKALVNHFKSVLSTGQDQERFLTVSARTLDLTGADCELRAANYLYNLLLRVQADIEKIPLDAETKGHIASYFAPLTHLTRLSHIHVSMGDAKRIFLSQESMAGYMNIHASLSGFVHSDPSPDELGEISRELQEYAREISDLSIPDTVKHAIIRRIEQVASMLHNFSFYGEDFAKDELEALVGSIVLNEEIAGEKGKSVFKKLLGAAGRALQIVVATNSGVDAVVGIVDNADRLARLFDSK